MKSFEEVFEAVSIVFEPVYGVGKLATYDTTAAICRTYDIPINNIYIIGSGPKRAVRLLNIPVFTDVQLNIKYAKREDVLKVFGNNLMSNDDLETRLCNWQKTI